MNFKLLVLIIVATLFLSGCQTLEERKQDCEAKGGIWVKDELAYSIFPQYHCYYPAFFNGTFMWGSWKSNTSKECHSEIVGYFGLILINETKLLQLHPELNISNKTQVIQGTLKECFNSGVCVPTNKADMVTKEVCS